MRPAWHSNLFGADRQSQRSKISEPWSGADNHGPGVHGAEQVWQRV